MWLVWLVRLMWLILLVKPRDKLLRLLALALVEGIE